MFVPTRRLLSALPVTVAEFRESLASIWLPRLRVEPRLGLAVSGGVDSMALATLCSDLAHEISEDDPDDRFRAFIVDHKLREESTEEALTVKRALGHLGIQSEVLQMQWPENVDAKNLPGLEHHARKLRFRLLGQACRKHGIEALLVAHHSDDQAETVMMRLIDGHQGRGLRGIRESNDIPESFGIHGVHRSHASDETYDPDIPFAMDAQHSIENEDGGVQVLRPLLPFTKDRLVATCLEAETPWVEDQTNQDPTLTPRNAIRHLFNNYRLPAALGKNSLLGISQRVSERIARQSQEVDDMINSVDAVLDVRSGEIAVRFPRNFFPPNSMPLSNPIGYGYIPSNFTVAPYDSEHGKIVGAMFLQKLIHLVTPYESVNLSQLEMATRYLFPKLFISDPIQPSEAHVPPSFTVGGVLFERLAAPVLYFPYFTWLLSRQPYSGAQTLPSLSIPPTHEGEDFYEEEFEEEQTGNITTQSDESAETTSVIQPQIATEQDHQDDNEGISLTAKEPSPPPQPPGFQLYDGRFWIRVHNPSATHHLIVRPFRPTDLKPLRASLQGSMHERFEGLRIDAAKSKARYTLPVIAAVNPNDSTDTDTILAMPSFGVKINKGPIAEEWKDLRWDIRYKRLDSAVLVRDSWDDYPMVVKRWRDGAAETPYENVEGDYTRSEFFTGNEEQGR